MPLPIGFFMPLPLPIMIPFMMWQSAAIAAGFGTYFQFAKRRVSAMSNEEFNKADPHDLVNSMYNDIVQQIPSSFAKVDSLTPVMLQSMNVMLDQAVKWLQGAITGNFFGTPNPVNPLDEPGLPGLPEPPAELISVSSETVSSWSNLVLTNAHFRLSDYDAESQIFIKQFYKTRITDKEEPTDFTNFVPPQDIPWMSIANIKIQAKARIERHVDPQTAFFQSTWNLQTNPQRNGNYITKRIIQGDREAAITNMRIDFPQDTHSLFGDKIAFISEHVYSVLKTDITIKNFPKP